MGFGAMELCGRGPILCAPVIRQVDEQLITLLRSLDAGDWDLSTIAPGWRVRDVAAHLLDTALRRLSSGRDTCRVDRPEIHSFQDVIELVNRLNREGVTVYRRFSPAVLIEIMQWACAQTADYYESLDPFAEADYGVSWAGESRSQAWFDVARELTERWHHQQQIRLATERLGTMEPALYHPVLDTFLRGLPYAYRGFAARSGTALLIEIAGDCGGHWCLVRQEMDWQFASEVPSAIASRVTIPQEIAWRVFTKGIHREAARAQITVQGDVALGEHLLELVAIVG